jgi:hypothetical protein
LVCPCADETQVCLSMSVRAAGPIGLLLTKLKNEPGVDYSNNVDVERNIPDKW